MSAHLRPLYEVKAGRPPAGKMASALKVALAVEESLKTGKTVNLTDLK
jgi:hypothetical protein